MELVDEAAGSYLFFELHVELLQADEGTQRSDEPVSSCIGYSNKVSVALGDVWRGVLVSYGCLQW